LWRRLPLTIALTAGCWLGIFVLFGFLLSSTPTPSPQTETIEAQIVELPGDGLAGGGGGVAGGTIEKASNSATKKAPSLTKFATKAPHVARTREVKPVVHKDLPVIAAIDKTSPSSVAHNDETKVVPKSESNSSSAPISSNNSSTTGPEGSGNGAGNGSGNGASEGSGIAAGGGFGSGGNGPEVIYAPVPSIPDDMRDEVVQADAVARFRVFHNGKIMVSLSEPTEFSQLNEIILETLRQWRFHPARRDGVPIDSDAEVHLRITVQ
jgi:hypothetical protein